MSKQESWKESLQAVRESMQEKPVVEPKIVSEEESLHEEIENLLNSEFDEKTVSDDTEVNLDEDVILEASAGDMIDKLFNLKGDKDAGYGVAKMLNMTGVKVVQAMQKQNPKGFMNTVKALGRDSKIKLATNNQLMKMFKDQGVKPIPESTETPEKTIEKLAERNMLGRLAKQLKLNEEGKQKMFSYFEKGEL
jgi:hypothetical protein